MKTTERAKSKSAGQKRKIPACSGATLAAALKGCELSKREFEAWHQDLKTGRKNLKSPREKWALK